MGLAAFIVDRGGTPTMVVALDLYMDAPQMSLPLSQHDLHSKPRAVALSGPVVFRSDGRIAIDLRNALDVPISVGISAPFGITGAVTLTLPAGEMHLSCSRRRSGRGCRNAQRQSHARTCARASAYRNTPIQSGAVSSRGVLHREERRADDVTVAAALREAA